MLTARTALKLKPLLDALLVRKAALARDLAADPVRFPRRFRDQPDDAEFVALLSACVAYGQAQVFGARLETMLSAMGPRPSAFAREFDAARDARVFRGVIYRFNTPADFAALVGAAGRLQREHGGLGQFFARLMEREAGLTEALAAFVRALREAVDPGVERHLGPLRGLDHLLPRPERGGACKRWMLFLRWMARGGPGDPVDLGLWARPTPAELIVPLDTHLGRMARQLGLTARADNSLRTALEITDSLRLLDADDPVKYDFALCHLGMSGECPVRRDPACCARCSLAPACRVRARRPAAPAERRASKRREAGK